MSTAERIERLRSAARVFDINSDGQIDASEMMILGIELHGGTWSAAQNEAAYQALDANGDGTCTIDEFVAFYGQLIGNCSDEQFEKGMARLAEAAGEITTATTQQRDEVEAIADIIPPSQDRIAGTEFAALVAEHNSTSIVETVHAYFCNIGEYTFRSDMEPRAFLQFISDARLLDETFTYADAEDLCSKLVEDGCDRIGLEAFYVALSKIAFYKYKLAPVDTAETFLEDHILPLEAEAQNFLSRRPWENAREPSSRRHLMVSRDELISRCYLFYTEEGQPMVFEDFRIFAQDFEIIPQFISLDDLRQLFAMSPRPWMNEADFMCLIQACTGDGEGALEYVVSHPAMQRAIAWFDSQTNGLPVEQWALYPQQSTFEPFKPYLDRARKDEPVRLTDSPYVVVHADEISARPADSELLPGPSNHRLTDAKSSDKPWEKQRLRGDLARERRIRGKEAPIVKSLEAIARSPAPYGKEPQKHHAAATESILEEFCALHRVDLQLLFDTYGFRDYASGGGKREGIIMGGELHRLIWDAGILGVRKRGSVRARKGVFLDVDDYFSKCVGNVYRESLRVSYDRFKVMLVRTAEAMSAQRNGVHPQKHVVDACRDLVRDYLVPLCNANFWTEPRRN